MIYEVKTELELRRAVQENNNSGGGAKIILEPYGRIHIGQEEIEIVEPVAIDGQNVLLQGKNGTIFAIKSGKVKIENIRFSDIKTGIRVDGAGKEISDIQLNNNRFQNFTGAAIAVASTVSNSVIKGVRILHNEFEGKKDVEEETMDGFTVGININAAKAETGSAVDNCTAEDILIKRNRTRGGHRFGINICTSSCNYNGALEQIGWRKNPILKNIQIIDNDLDGAWDSTINVIGGLLRQEKGILEGLEIAYNRICYGVWGIGAVAGEPLYGPLENAVVKDAFVHHNLCRAQTQGAGEAQHAIAFCAGRIDYFHGASCHNVGFENIRIAGNTILDTDRGIFIAGTDSVLDGRNSEFSHCYVRNVMIERNTLKGVSEAFIIMGAYLEGRLFDWNIGLPRHNKPWSPLFEDNREVSCKCHDNQVSNVTIRENYIMGNRYKYRLFGVFAHGHAILENNILSQIVVENNLFKETEGHIHVACAQYDDWCKDDGGNYVDENLKYLL